MTRKKLRRYRKKHLKAHEANNGGSHTTEAESSSPFSKNSLNMESFMALQPPLNVTPPVIRT